MKLIERHEYDVDEESIREIRQEIDQSDLGPDEKAAAHRELDRMIHVTAQPWSD